MSRIYDRNYQVELWEMLDTYGYPADEILDHVLDWLDSDIACKALEDFCVDNEIELPEED